MRNYKIILLALTCFASFPAIAEESPDLRRPAENPPSTQERKYAQNDDVPMPGQGANIEVRLSAYEEQLRRLRGRIEELQHSNQQLQERLDKSQADSDFRFRELEKKTGVAPAASAENTPAPAPAAPAPAPAKAPDASDEPLSHPGSAEGGREKNLTITPEPAPSSAAHAAKPSEPAKPKSPEQRVREEYDQAFDLLRDKKYSEAIAAFDKFTEDHATSPLASGAYYWIGEAYFVQNDFETAAKKFVAGYKKFPKGQKAPETLLKLGMSLSGMGKKKEACTAYDKLAGEFPKSSAAVKKRLDKERQKLNCQ